MNVDNRELKMQKIIYSLLNITQSNVDKYFNDMMNKPAQTPQDTSIIAAVVCMRVISNFKIFKNVRRRKMYKSMFPFFTYMIEVCNIYLFLF